MATYIWTKKWESSPFLARRCRLCARVSRYFCVFFYFSKIVHSLSFFFVTFVIFLFFICIKSMQVKSIRQMPLSFNSFTKFILPYTIWKLTSYEIEITWSFTLVEIVCDKRFFDRCFLLISVEITTKLGRCMKGKNWGR